MPPLQSASPQPTSKRYDYELLGSVFTFSDVDLQGEGLDVIIKFDLSYQHVLNNFVGAIGKVRKARYVKDALDVVNVNYGDNRANVTSIALAGLRILPINEVVFPLYLERMMRGLLLVFLATAEAGLRAAPTKTSPLVVTRFGGHVQLTVAQQTTMHFGCVESCKPSPVESKCVTACEAAMYGCIDHTGPNETPEDTEKCQTDVLKLYTETKGVEKAEEKAEEKKEVKKEEKVEEKAKAPAPAKEEPKPKSFIQVVRDDDESEDTGLDESSEDMESGEDNEELQSEEENSDDVLAEEEEETAAMEHEEGTEEISDEGEEGYDEASSEGSEEEEEAVEEPTEAEEESFVQKSRSSWKPEPCDELEPGVPCVHLYEHPQGSTFVTPCPVEKQTNAEGCSAYFGGKADAEKCPQISCPKALGVTMKLTCGGGCCPTCWAPDHVISLDRHSTVDDAAVVEPAPQAPGSCKGVKCFQLACAAGFKEGFVNGDCCYSCVPGR